MRLRCLLSLLAVATALSLTAGKSPLRNSYVGKAPPELVADKEHWLGTAPPVTLAELRGKVVWLQFNF